MGTAGATCCEWRAEIPATLESIDRYCFQFRKWYARSASLRVFDAELLIREGLNNAVVHGSASDPRKSISCVLRFRPGRLLIGIRDTGPGFDWRALRNQHTDVQEIHSRGLEILKAYASSVRFNSKGNCVVMVKKCDE
jgi:serine/threonine-protein kinase RsbW